MIRALAVAFILLGTTGALSQQISIPLYLQVGDAYEMQTVTRKAPARGSARTEPQTYSTTSRIDVVEEVGAGHLLSVSLLSWDFSDTDPTLGAMMEAIVSSYADRTFLFETDEFGLPIRLRDWRAFQKEIATDTIRALDKLIAERLDEVPADARPETAQSIRSMAESMIAAQASMDDAQAAVVIGEDLTLWSYPTGLQLTVGEPVSGPIEIPSPFGGDNLAGTETLSLVEIDGTVARIDRIQQIDQAESQALIEGLLGALQIPDAQREQVRAQLATMEFSIRSDQVFLTDIETGFTEDVAMTKSSVLGEVSRSVEGMRITVKKLQ